MIEAASSSTNSKLTSLSKLYKNYILTSIEVKIAKNSHQTNIIKVYIIHNVVNIVLFGIFYY